MPLRPSGVSGGELSHSSAPDRDGKPPSTPRFGSWSAGFSFIIIAGPPFVVLADCVDALARSDGGRIRSIRLCSSDAVPDSETRVRKPVSKPNAMAATATGTATPKARLIHSPTPSDRFIAANIRPPTASASASDVAAPAAYASRRSVVPTLAPLSAAPVRMRPSTGPAHGAHRSPVATPSNNEGNICAPGAPASR